MPIAAHTVDSTANTTHNPPLDDQLGFAPIPADITIMSDAKLTVPDATFAPETLSPADRRVRALNLGAVIVPFLALILAIVLSWGSAINWTQLIIYAVMVELTAIGVTIGFHRLFTHRAFATTSTIRYIFGALGSMAVQGTVYEWCATHRKHHQHSDDHHDPHSPHAHSDGVWGEGLIGFFKGFYHSHMGWLFAGRMKGSGKYIKDIAADPVCAAINRQFRFWVIAGLLLPAIAGGLIEQSWHGAWMGLLWGGFVRILTVHHVTWSVNSVCHLWGTSPFRTHDESRNNPVIGVLTLGEGWHNNHHAFPNSARHGLHWWQIDISYIVIRSLELVGLAWNIKLPDKERIAAKRRRNAHTPST
ncbi:MAG: fatty acid desaturase [Phycisphaerales bacterium]|nr:fatty acid desaturase [Phycisphaerales bacterium]